MKEKIIKHKEKEYIITYDTDDEDLIKSLPSLRILKSRDYLSVVFKKGKTEYKSDRFSRAIMKADDP